MIHYTLDGSEPDERSAVYSEPLRLTRTTTLKARAYKEGLEPSGIYSITATKAEYRRPASYQLSEHGVNYTYYEGEFQRVADLAKAKPVKSGTMPEPSIAGATLADHFGYVFTGYIDVPADGVYEFIVRSDDGSVLYIGGDKVVDNDGGHAAIDASGRVPLRKGFHPFTLRYFEDYEGEHLSWRWRVPGSDASEPIPAERLYLPPNTKTVSLLEKIE